MNRIKIQFDNQKFIVRYFFYLMAILTFFYFNTFWIFSFVNEAQTDFTLFILHIFLDSQHLENNNIWITPYYYLVVDNACNGIVPILFLYASILAVSVPFLHKIVWILIGYLALFVTNIVRLLLIVKAVQLEGGQSNFYWAHDIMGNILLVGTGLIIFFLFLKTTKTY